MYSHRELQIKMAQLAETIVRLTPAEENELKKLVTEISESNDKSQLAVKYLIEDEKHEGFLSLVKIFKFVENSATFKQFCQDTSLPHTKNWSVRLKEKKFPHSEIKLLVNTTVTIYDLYMGAFFLTSSCRAESAAEKLYWLDKACDAGSFHALMLRTNTAISKLKDIKGNFDAIQSSINTLVTDIQPLGDIYGTAGYFHSAKLLQQLGNFYANEEDLESKLGASTCYEAAAEKFVCGKILYEDAELNNDVELFNILTKSKGLSAFGFDTINKGEEIFLSDIKNCKSIVDRAYQVINEKRKSQEP